MKCKDCTDIECKRRGGPNMKCFYEEDSQEELEENYNWQSFRNQAAKDILCAMLNTRYYDNTQRKQGCVEEAIYFANELIKKLKEKEEG